MCWLLALEFASVVFMFVQGSNGLVEELFSDYGFTMSPRRNKLSSKVLCDLMMIRSNKALVKGIPTARILEKYVECMQAQVHVQCLCECVVCVCGTNCSHQIGARYQSSHVHRARMKPDPIKRAQTNLS